MPRPSRYDNDEERLPEGMTRVGYDADTQVYTFQDSDGSYWEGAPGCQYGQLTRVGSGPDYDAADTEPFLASEQTYPNKSWRHELMPLLNFGVILGVFFLLLIWYLHRMAGGEPQPSLTCSVGSSAYQIKSGDTCWRLSEAKGISVDDILKLNNELNCERLRIGSEICLPE